MNQEEQEKANKLKLDRLRGTWYHATPDKLYDLCIRKVVRNIELILTRTTSVQADNNGGGNTTKKSKSKYTISEHVGPLPSPICESIIREYARFYVDTLSQLERDEYFNNEEVRRKQSSSSSRLVNYHDVLMAFVCTPDKCSLASLDYRQCMWATSTLETRLKQKYEAQLAARRQPIESSYFKLVRTTPPRPPLNKNSKRTKSR